MMKNSLNQLLCLFLFAFIQNLLAQDNHYAAQQVGARAGLLGAAVVGGLADNSAMYYNPAAFAYLTNSNVSLNTNMSRVEFMTLENGLGQGIDAFSTRVSLYPQTVSALLTHNTELKYRIGFIVFTRHQANNDYSQRHSFSADLSSAHIGKEYFVGQVDLQNSINEKWAGLCLSRQLSSKFSIGNTPFLSYRNQRYLYNIYALLSSSDSLASNPIATQSYKDALRLNMVRLFFKAGFHYRLQGWHAGLTLTTAAIHIWTDAKVDRNITFFGLARPDVVYTDRQWYMPARYRQPFSIALGLMKQTKQFSIGFSAEYFARVKDYRMAETALRDVELPSSGLAEHIDFLGFSHQADPVLNASVGMELYLNETWTIHSSFYTDFATQRKRNEININNLERPRLLNPLSDLYHTTLGFSLRKHHSVLTAGITYTFGHANSVQQQANFSAPLYPDNLWGNTEPIASLTHHALSLALGYTYYFALLN